MNHNWVYIVQKPAPPKPPKLTGAEQMYHGAADLLEQTKEQRNELNQADEGASVSGRSSLTRS